MYYIKRPQINVLYNFTKQDKVTINVLWIIVKEGLNSRPARRIVWYYKTHPSQYLTILWTKAKGLSINDVMDVKEIEIVGRK